MQRPPELKPSYFACRPRATAYQNEFPGVTAAAAAGLALSWVLFRWLGSSSEYCDYPEECLTSFFPAAFDVARWLWLSVLLAAGAGTVLASRSQARTRDVALLGTAWLAILLSVGTSPLYGIGEQMTQQQAAATGFLALDGSTHPDAQLVAGVVLAASAVFGSYAARSLGPRSLGPPPARS